MNNNQFNQEKNELNEEKESKQQENTNQNNPDDENHQKPLLDHMGNPINHEQNKKNVTYIILIFVAIAFLSMGYNSTSVTLDTATMYENDY